MPARYRQLAFVLSSALAGIAGALYASTFSYIDPDIAAFHVSAMLLAMVILGGAGSVTGAILGTVLIYSYDKVLIGQLFALLSPALAARPLHRPGARYPRHQLFQLRHRPLPHSPLACP